MQSFQLNLTLLFKNVTKCCRNIIQLVHEYVDYLMLYKHMYENIFICACMNGNFFSLPTPFFSRIEVVYRHPPNYVLRDLGKFATNIDKLKFSSMYCRYLFGFFSYDIPLAFLQNLTYVHVYQIMKTSFWYISRMRWKLFHINGHFRKCSVHVHFLTVENIVPSVICHICDDWP